MKRSTFIFVSFVCFLLPFGLSAKNKDHASKNQYVDFLLNRHRMPEHSQQEQMLLDLQFINGLFQVSYAPIQWKKDHCGINLKSIFAGAEEKIRNKRNISTKEFQGIIKELCFEMQDYHVAPEFYSTECAFLPFCIQGAEGRYFISYVDEEVIEKENLNLKIGDEVLFLNNVEIGSLVQTIKNQEVGVNYHKTDSALAELYLTMRLGSLGHIVPKGPVSLVTLPKNSRGQFRKATIKTEWAYIPELVKSAPAMQFIRSSNNLFQNTSARKHFSHSYFKKEFSMPQYKAFKKVFGNKSPPSVMLGAKKNMLPSLGKVLWETSEEDEFHAYLFAMPDQKTGAYIRISSFYEDESTAADFFEIIKKFEKEADVLVLDIVNNPGGSILYMYAILSSLTNKPLEIPQHRIRITQEDVYFAAIESCYLETIDDLQDVLDSYGENMDGMAIDAKLLKGLEQTFKFIIEQWDKGNIFTDLHYLYGIDQIAPHPEIRFTKPLLVLANSLSFSAGDFLPAILQDNHRGKIMGSRTAGAGGYVEQVSFPNLNGISGIDLTCSYSIRSNGFPIENLGVNPDIPYDITEVDLQHHYQEYVAKILEELQKLN